MAEDLVQYHLDTLREARDSSAHSLVNDRQLLIVAEMLGSIDPMTGQPRGKRYLAKELTSKQAKDILDGIQKNTKADAISPGEAVGVIAGQSIGEPFTQAIMRTFHYAGVASTISPEQSLTDAVGHHENHNHSICLALRGDHGMDLRMAQRVNNKLQRFMLGKFVEVTIEHANSDKVARLAALENLIHEFEGDRYQTSERYSEMLDEMVTIYGDPTPEFGALLDEAQVLRQELRDEASVLTDSRTLRFSFKSDEMAIDGNTNRLRELEHGWTEEEFGSIASWSEGMPMPKLKPEMDMSNLRSILTRIMMTTRGKYKSVTGMPGFYESVRFFDADNGDFARALSTNHLHTSRRPRRTSAYAADLCRLLQRIEGIQA